MYRERIDGQRPQPTHFAGPVGATGQRPLRRRVHTREILLTSAEQLFIERGYAQVSVSDICGAAGFTRGAFYSSFADKDDLMLALFDQHAGERLERLRAMLTDAPARNADEWAQSLLAVTPQDRGWILLFLEFRLLAVRQPELAAKIDHHDEVVTAALADILGQQPWASRFPAPQLAKFLLAAREGILARTVRDDGSAPDMVRAVIAVATKAFAALNTDPE
ncbi:TetR/AcrR family transcriptional regulator [Mycolicibacterium moriokaense]|uniref:TetR family transcriptional regulator n=1 Tax=Mycolicibacterium moriokaense TaxID=39691 RepID=A0A318HXX4_9MYCO|nr:TetR/AcrR family transcriptional regulator [Mycolicibacterium moriokaense]PXX10330.1 TetR family transcriptional regulator [Mycolicibacterium moriokaense]